MKNGEKLLTKLNRLNLSVKERHFIRTYGPVLSKMRRDPVYEARLLLGIVVPPHQRAILRMARSDTREINLIGSRGSSKSFSLCSLAPVLDSLVYSRRKYLSLSASKFRGGKIIMEEALSVLKGQLLNQKQSFDYTSRVLLHRAGLKRETDRWIISFSNNTNFFTVPTGSTETIRGLRAQWLAIDEADNWDAEDIAKIIKPFLAVGGNFENPGADSISNKVIFAGTISYAHKDWAKKLKDRMNLLRRQFEAYRALYGQDYEKWREIINADNERIKHHSIALQVWDYTDLIIPTVLKNHNVHYPRYNRAGGYIEINPEELIKYDSREKVNYIYTYPVEKSMAEDELEDGLSDYDSWAAEWRCQFIESSGNVYPMHVVEAAHNTELLSPVEAKKKGWDVETHGPYYPQLLYECDDPCVLGIDPARTDDFSAFVVIRIGELAKGEFDPKKGEGATPWNNVIWAEQRRNMTTKEVAEKILELKSRYNLILSDNPEKAPAIAIDARGASGGATVRDDLARPTPPVDEFGNVSTFWKSPQKIYDPLDKDYKHLSMDKDSWPGLRLLWTNDQMNTELVSFSKGQLETSRLYIAKDVERRLRVDQEGKLNPGYIGIRTLINQIMSIQSQPTRYHQKFYMPGSAKEVQNKKDLFSAFLYASYAVRAHLATSVKAKKQEPTTVGFMMKQPSRINIGGYRF